MDLLGSLQREHGLLPARFGKTGRQVAVTDDLVRIRDAERRDWQTDPELHLLVDLATKHLRHTDVCGFDPDTCEGCKAKALKPAQAVFLRELHDVGEGAVGTLRVGAGKTLASLLAATVTGSSKPLLIVPANCVQKTLAAAQQYARHWRIKPCKVVSYEFLAGPKRLHWLEEYQPDLIIADEAQKLKDSSTKCAKRIRKYLKVQPSCRFVVLSGSIAGRSIREHWHYVRWAMRSRAPVPHDPMEMEAWALAMDEKIPEDARFDPGALLELATTNPDDEPLVRARKAYQARFTSTRGIVSTLEDIPPVGLRLWSTVVELPAEAKAAIEMMRETWQTPAGEDFSTAMDLWRHARTLGCGLFYRWDPPPPPEWMAARRSWHKYAREVLAHSRSKDSIVHVIESIKKGELDDGGLYAAWKEIEPSFVPNPVPVWVHDTLVAHAASWLASHPHGIVWAEHSAFGRLLAERAGVPYFASQGQSEDGTLIDDYRGGPCVASVKGCGTGHNLQFFSDNLFPSPLSKGDLTEQALGRTHRDGQQADEVTAEFLITCKESAQCLAQSLRDARFMHHTLGQPQKLCYGEFDFSAVRALAFSPETSEEIGV